jgi:GTP-binding protein
VPGSLEAEFAGSFFDISELPRDSWPHIAIAGRSNVGKSTLLNKVLGRKKLAKVSSTPGKTRSLNFFSVNGRFYLVDLPGYGYARASKQERKRWGILIEKYLTSAERLAGLVLLLDCRREPTPEDMTLLEWLSHRQVPVLGVVTKADKVGRFELNRKVEEIEEAMGIAALPFSSKSGIGKRELTKSILDLVKNYRMQ